jgi:hypothetical protein
MSESTRLLAEIISGLRAMSFHIFDQKSLSPASDTAREKRQRASTRSERTGEEWNLSGRRDFAARSNQFSFGTPTLEVAAI